MGRRAGALSVALWCALAWAPGAFAQGDAGFAQDTPAQHFARAMSAWEHEQWDAARVDFAWVAGHDASPLAARAEWHLGALSDRENAFADALVHYQRSLELDPGSRFAGRAEARVAYLHAHESQAFSPLAQLQALRADPRAQRDPARLEALTLAADRWTDEGLRADARLLVAAAWLRMGRISQGETLLRAMMDRPGTPREPRASALRLLEQLAEQRGSFAELARDLARWSADPDTVRRVGQRARRLTLHAAARAHLLFLTLATVGLFALALRRGLGGALRKGLGAALPWMQLGMLCVGSGLLARTWGDHDARPFWALAAGVAVLQVLAVEARVTLPRGRVLGVLKGVLLAAGVLAVAFEATFRYDQGMLEGIGL